MTQARELAANTTSPIGGRSFAAFALLALAVGCGEAPVAPVYRGSGGSTATGGTSGTGGMSGTGGVSGTGGTSGTGGMTGTGGSSGAGGTGGTAGTPGSCQTTALCHTCPDRFLCDTDEDCTFSGYVCVSSGCETLGGSPIKQCVPSWGASCSTDGDCPNAADYDCVTVGAGADRCVRVASGCSQATETYDCAPGFSCEAGTCVDRRVPCDSYLDCPKSHICLTAPVSQYCARVSRTCHVDEDCSWLGNNLGAFCDDVDGDGVDECTGERDASGSGCVNSACASDEVCETSAVGSAASCGSYGLCLNHMDCPVDFECLELWQDGRKECVPIGGDCDRVTDCPVQQVCAASRNGDAPSCQSGSAP